MKRVYNIYIVLWVLFFAGCLTPEKEVYETKDDYLEREQNYLNQYQQSVVTLIGNVLSESGVPIPGAQIQCDNFSAVSDSQGRFEIPRLPRINRFFSITAAGFRQEWVPVYLNVPLPETQVVLAPLYLNPTLDNEVRFLFAGDNSFARRFLDPSDLTPRDQIPIDHPDALIQASNPLPGSMGVVRFVRPYFLEADFSTVNFESVITANPRFPHMEKDYAYFTLPGSIPALTWLGVDYVSVGNNHLYDYLDQGLTDTLRYLAAEHIPYSGAGPLMADTYLAYRTNLKSHPYAFLSMTSITGEKHSISYVADETKGGAADLTRTDLVLNAMNGELNAGYIPILQLHGGTEYSFVPTEFIASSMRFVTRHGAALVISHHPHVAQGVGLINGVITLYGLGNFAFDQDRVETLFGLLGRVDMQGAQVCRVRMLPIYLEDYRPRPVCGAMASLLLRRIAEFSGKNIATYPYNNQLWVEWGQVTRQVLQRTVTIEVTVPDSGVAVVDLRGWQHDNESLSGISANRSNIAIRIGRDIMLYGDFEDYDADDDTFEMARWDITNESVAPSLSKAYRGTTAIASTRSTLSESDSVIPYRNRVRVMGDEYHTPNKDLTFFGYVCGESAGRIAVITRFAASTLDAEFGEEEVYSHGGGTFAWQPMVGDIHMPPDDPAKIPDTTANPRAIRLFLHHSPPAENSGVAFFDEIAIINWEETLTENSPIATPHARDFLKITAPPGPLRLTCSFTAYRPR